jgi:phage terminase large subunit-like protein
VARAEQLPPDLAGLRKAYWLVMAGRGWGKTRVGAEWTRAKAHDMPGSFGHLVAKDPGEARDVMIEGQSGLLACSPPFDMPKYNPSLKRITWPNGTRATVFSSEEYEELRGPQCHWVWGDEPGKWNAPSETWEQILFGMRLGANPEACLTTTPRPTKMLKRLLVDPLTQVSRGTTYDNTANLSPVYRSIVSIFEGTRLGRQELSAELLDDNPGALWTYDLIDKARMPPGLLRTVQDGLARVVVGVDPTASSDGAEAGIVVSGRGIDQHGYVLADVTLQGRPEQWGRAAVAAARLWGADRIVAEDNNGGEMVEATIRAVDPTAPVKRVHASRGKIARAEPISALYEQGLIHHVGIFPQLEDQMTSYQPLEIKGSQASPDRMDALVWSLTELFETQVADLKDAFFGARQLSSSRGFALR